MASSSSHPQRSISLPSRLTNLTSLRIEADLEKLRSAESSSSHPLNLDLIQERLLDLANLYISSDEYLTQTISTQQTLLSYELVKDALTRSDRFLAILSTVRELVTSMNDQVRDLESAIRRRGGGCSTYVTSYINAYLGYRKKSKKEIGKGLRVIKQMEEHERTVLSDGVIDPTVTAVFRVMREVALATVSVMKLLLLSLSLPASVKGKRWSVLISKLMVGTGKLTKGSCKEVELELFNEVSKVDISLSSTMVESKDELDMVQGRLRTMDDAMHGLEGAMDCVYRRLIQSRVTLLNILVA